MSIPHDSKSYPTNAVMKAWGLDGPDVLYHAYMLSWECFKAVKRGEEPNTTVYPNLHYDALKLLFHQHNAGLMKDPRNRMPHHPNHLLTDLSAAHVAAAKHYGYWGIEQ